MKSIKFFLIAALITLNLSTYGSDKQVQKIETNGQPKSEDNAQQESKRKAEFSKETLEFWNSTILKNRWLPAHMRPKEDPDPYSSGNRQKIFMFACFKGKLSILKDLFTVLNHEELLDTYKMLYEIPVESKVLEYLLLEPIQKLIFYRNLL